MIASKKPAVFEIAPDAVDPGLVPRRKAYTGATIPVLGLGTFGSDRFTGEQIAEAVLEAAAVGYRHFDCASVYGNKRRWENHCGRSSKEGSNAKSCG